MHLFDVAKLTIAGEDQLKIAKVVPVYKSENRSLVSNYRPISSSGHIQNFGKTCIQQSN